MHRLPSNSTRLACRTTHTHAYTKCPSFSSIISTQQLHTTTPRHSLSTPSLFNLSALSNSRETHALSKASGLGVLNHSTALQQLDAESRAHLPAGQREIGLGNVNGSRKAGLKNGKAVDEVTGKRDGLEAGGRLGVGVDVRARTSTRPLSSISIPNTIQPQLLQVQHQQPPKPSSPTTTAPNLAPPSTPQALTASYLDSKLNALQASQDVKLLVLGERMLAANSSWLRFSSFVVVAASLLSASVLVLSYSDLRDIGGALGLQSNVVDRLRNKKEAKKSKDGKAKASLSSKKKKKNKKDKTNATVKQDSPTTPRAESNLSGLAWLWQQAPTKSQHE